MMPQVRSVRPASTILANGVLAMVSHHFADTSAPQWDFWKASEPVLCDEIVGREHCDV